jgi:hypothetical protein
MSDGFTGIKNGTVFQNGLPVAEHSTVRYEPMKNRKNPLDVLKSNTTKMDEYVKDSEYEEKKE